MPGNSIVSNDMQFSGCYCDGYNTEEIVHTWDNGKKGNYWSDYNGTDSNKDGLGDTPYVIDVLNQDRYPLIEIFAVPPTPSAALKLPIEAILVAVAFVTIACIALAIYSVNRNKKAATKETFSEYFLCMSEL
jgi:hypothetical protein